ncbi:MAG: restriction endonuclease subunit S, partial [Chloroflexota bacterium]|nr:restriction endonuclease subunit S [Chloroflexota bacterium]
FRTHVTGTTGSRQRVRSERTLEFPCVIPSAEVMQRFEQIVGTYWKQIDTNLHENQALTRTRDYLLPKLLSGEVEVKAA